MADGMEITQQDLERAGTVMWNDLLPPVNAIDIEDDIRHPSADKRTQTRRARGKARRKRLQAEREARLNKENLVLAVAASGAASFEQISRRTGIPKTTVHRLYHSAMERVGSENVAEFKQMMQFRLGTLLQSVWTDALGGDQQAVRNALAISAEQSKLEGAYPPAQVDVAGDITVRRELSVREAGEIVARIQAQRMLAGEAELPALTEGAPQLNGTAA